MKNCVDGISDLMKCLTELIGKATHTCMQESKKQQGAVTVLPRQEGRRAIYFVILASNQVRKTERVSRVSNQLRLAP